LYSEAVGRNRRGINRTPGKWRPFKYTATSRARNHGAPTISNGVSVPRPTETDFPSSKHVPGYKIASVKLRMLGDGLTHSNPVSSNHIERRQPVILMT